LYRIKVTNMNQRLQTLLEIEHLSPAQFADSLGIQRGGVSHILSGRNKPSFDFLEKVLRKYQNINAEWLITGNGKPIKEAPVFNSSNPYIKDTQVSNIQNSKNENELFGDFFQDTPVETPHPVNEASSPLPPSPPSPATAASSPSPVIDKVRVQEKRPVRVIIYFSDGTYSEFYPFSVPSRGNTQEKDV